MTVLWETPFSSVPPSNQFVSVSGHLKGFLSCQGALQGPSFLAPTAVVSSETLGPSLLPHPFKFGKSTLGVADGMKLMLFLIDFFIAGTATSGRETASANRRGRNTRGGNLNCQVQEVEANPPGCFGSVPTLPDTGTA